MQLTSTVQAITGHRLNMEEGLFDEDGFVYRVKDLLLQLEELTNILQKGNEWGGELYDMDQKYINPGKEGWK